MMLTTTGKASVLYSLSAWTLAGYPSRLPSPLTRKEAVNPFEAEELTSKRTSVAMGRMLLTRQILCS